MDAIIVIDSDIQKCSCVKAVLEFVDYENIHMAGPDEWQYSVDSPDQLCAIIIAESLVK